MVSESKKPTTHDSHEKQLDTKILRSVVLQMHEAFPKICIAWNVKGSMNKNWKMLFERLDTDGSGRLDYNEFTGALSDVLKIDVKAKRLEEAQKRAAALALARKEGSKRAVKFGAGVASAFGAAGVERAEKRAIAEEKARRKSASKKALLSQAAGSGSFRKAGVARAEARAIAEAEEAERLAREAEVPQSPARPYHCWCAPAPAPYFAPAPAPFEAEAEAYSEEEELAFEDEPLAGESVYEPDDDAVASDAEEAVASDADEPAEEELGEELMEEEEVVDEEDG